jgi:CheY-like chemotaxis protein
MTNEVDRAVEEILRARIVRGAPPDPPSVRGDAAEAATSTRVEASIVVLLVMDDLFFRKLVRRQLEAAGYLVAEAISAERALARLHPEPPDLVLLDTWIGRGTGMQFLETLKNDHEHRDIPVLLIGNDPRPDARARASALGALGPVPISRAVGVGLWVDAALYGNAGG